MKKLFLLFALLVFRAPAATYYIDFQSGDDAANGTSSSTPWKHCPGDTNATSIAASATFSGGDSILFKRGTTYNGTIIVGVSGAEDSPVIYDGGAWGTGERCLLTTSNAPNSYGFVVGDKNHLVFQNFHLKDIGGYAEDDALWTTTNAITSPPGGTGISISDGGSSIVVSNLFFEEIGQWQNTIPMSGVNSVTGTGIGLENNTNILIVDCEFTRMKTGVAIKAIDEIGDVTVLRCEFHNYMNWLIDIAPRSPDTTLRNITVDGCTFHDYQEFNRPNWQGYGEKPHQNGIFIRNGPQAGTVWTNIIVRNSLFYSDSSSEGGTASIFVSQGPSVDIYNCIFLADKNTAYVNVGYEKAGPAWQQVRVWNNTFVGGETLLKVSPGNSNPDYIVVKNNIFYRTTSQRNNSAVSMNRLGIGLLEMDHNLFFSDYSPDDQYYVISDSSDSNYKTLESWKLTGQDASSLVDSPQFTSLSGSPSGWNLRIGTNSPASDLGENLSDVFTTDIEGNPRTAWSAGAYAVSSGEEAEPVGVAPIIFGFSRLPKRLSLEPFGISGSNFLGATSVTIGGITAEFQVVADDLITATLPAVGVRSGITVAVTSGAGTGQTNSFAVLPRATRIRTQ